MFSWMNSRNFRTIGTTSLTLGIRRLLQTQVEREGLQTTFKQISSWMFKMRRWCARTRISMLECTPSLLACFASSELSTTSVSTTLWCPSSRSSIKCRSSSRIRTWAMATTEGQVAASSSLPKTSNSSSRPCPPVRKSHSCECCPQWLSL